MSVTSISQRHGIAYAAQFFGVSTDTIYRWCAEGRLAHYRLCNRILFAPEQLTRALQSAERPARLESTAA